MRWTWTATALGNLKLVNFPSMISNTGGIILGNDDPAIDSFKGTAFFPKLLAADDGVTVGQGVHVVAPKLANDIDDSLEQFAGIIDGSIELLPNDIDESFKLPKDIDGLQNDKNDDKNAEAEMLMDANVAKADEEGKKSARRLLSARDVMRAGSSSPTLMPGHLVTILLCGACAAAM